MSLYRLKASLLPSLLSSSSFSFTSSFVTRTAGLAATKKIPTPALDAKEARRPAPEPIKYPSKVSCNWNDETKFSLGHLRKSKDIFHRSNKLIRSATDIESLKRETSLEFAIMGRSNIGKSTLINRLTSTKLARVSSYPKRTKTLNFYSINSGKLFLVDFPGYEAAPSTESTSDNNDNNSQQYLYHYLTTRKNIKVLLLLDSERGVQINDFDLLTYLEDNNIKHQIIMAKADLVPQNLFEKRVKEVQELIQSHQYADQQVLFFSSTDKNTADKIRAHLVEYGRFFHIKEKPRKKATQAPTIDFDSFREEYLKQEDEKENSEQPQDHKLTRAEKIARKYRQ